MSSITRNFSGDTNYVSYNPLILTTTYPVYLKSQFLQVRDSDLQDGSPTCNTNGEIKAACLSRSLSLSPSPHLSSVVCVEVFPPILLIEPHIAERNTFIRLQSSLVHWIYMKRWRGGHSVWCGCSFHTRFGRITLFLSPCFEKSINRTVQEGVLAAGNLSCSPLLGDQSGVGNPSTQCCSLLLALMTGPLLTLFWSTHSHLLRVIRDASHPRQWVFLTPRTPSDLRCSVTGSRDKDKSCFLKLVNLPSWKERRQNRLVS